MKTIILTLLAAPALLMAQARPTITFSVSATGADKTELRRVLEAVQELEGGKNDKTAADFEVIQRIDLRNFLVYKKVWKERRAPVIGDSLSRIGGGGGVAGGGTYRVAEVDRSKVFWLITSRDHDNVADGEFLVGIIAIETGKTRETEEATGYPSTVRELKEKTDEAIALTPSQEEFVAALKSGKTWTLNNFTKTQCSRCNGKGNLGVLHENLRCPSCQGVGSLFSDCLVKW